MSNTQLKILFALFILNYSVGGAKNTKTESNSKIINCDSIYKMKGYQVSLVLIDSTNSDNSKINNTIFIFSKNIDNKKVELYRDTIYSRNQGMLFTDYNNDKIKDILIQNTLDAKSNWTFYLYLLDLEDNQLIKIKGFKNIKNPRFNAENNIIENYVYSGVNWTGFYKIKNNSIYDYGIIIEDTHESKNGTNKYDVDYIKAIKTIQKYKK